MSFDVKLETSAAAILFCCVNVIILYEAEMTSDMSSRNEGQVYSLFHSGLSLAMSSFVCTSISISHTFTAWIQQNGARRFARFHKSK